MAFLALGLVGCKPKSSSQETEMTVFAAASLTDVTQTLIQAYQKANPKTKIKLNVGSSSALAKQIVEGAPADLFLAASPDWIRFLQKKAQWQVVDSTRIGNTLVVVVPKTNAKQDWQSSEKVALADPSAVPAGQYAQKALVCMQVWEAVKPRVLPSQDVRAALETVRQGFAKAAIVYATDLQKTPDLVALTAAIPPSCQPTIRYGFAQKPQANAAVQDFMDYLHTQTQVWLSFGFKINHL